MRRLRNISVIVTAALIAAAALCAWRINRGFDVKHLAPDSGRESLEFMLRKTAICGIQPQIVMSGDTEAVDVYRMLCAVADAGALSVTLYNRDAKSRVRYEFLFNKKCFRGLGASDNLEFQFGIRVARVSFSNTGPVLVETKDQRRWASQIDPSFLQVDGALADRLDVFFEDGVHIGRVWPLLVLADANIGECYTIRRIPGEKLATAPGEGPGKEE